MDTLLEEIARSLCNQHAKYYKRAQPDWRVVPSAERSFWRQMARTSLVRVTNELCKIADSPSPQKSAVGGKETSRVTVLKANH